LPDNDNSTILLNIAKDSDSKFGVDIISEGVKEYNYDSLFIIAKTYNNRDGVISFWLIDKREPKRVDHCIEKQCIDSILTSLIIKKFDSTDFYNYLLQNNIELRF